MELNSALDILIKDLREAREIINDLRHIKGVPLIQIELAKAKCKSAEEIIELMKSIYTLPSEPVVTKSDADMGTEPDVVNHGKNDKSDTIVEEVLIIEEETKPPEESQKGTEPLTVSDQPAKSPSLKKSPAKNDSGKPILADRFNDAGNRVNEKMRDIRNDDDITSRISRAPVTNLADAIGINEKFYFIREVFGGDSHTYNNAIGKLNEITGISEAENVINDLAGADADPDAVKSLLEIVKRKTGLNG